MNKEEFTQEQFEDVLSSHWHILYVLKELEDTNTGSALRLKSITDRKEQLRVIENQIMVLEQLSDYPLIYPDWYNDRIKEIIGEVDDK